MAIEETVYFLLINFERGRICADHETIPISHRHGFNAGLKTFNDLLKTLEKLRLHSFTRTKPQSFYEPKITCRIYEYSTPCCVH